MYSTLAVGLILLGVVRFRYIIDAIQKEDLVKNAQDIGRILLWALRKFPALDNVRGRGLMIAFDLDSPEQRDKMMALLQENMLVLKSGEKSIRLRPSLTFSADDVDLATSYISEAIHKL